MPRKREIAGRPPDFIPALEEAKIPEMRGNGQTPPAPGKRRPSDFLQGCRRSARCGYGSDTGLHRKNEKSMGARIFPPVEYVKTDPRQAAGLL